MRNQLLRILLILLISQFYSVSTQAQALSLSGSLYRYNAGSNESMPVANYRVYIYSDPTGWLGPSITDNYGAFAFYDVPRGEYLLRIYATDSKDSQVWEQAVQVPGTIDPIALK